MNYFFKLVFLVTSLLMTSCSSFGRLPTKVTLIVPETFRGEIYVVEDANTGQNWHDGSIVVPASGIASVKDFSGLSSLLPENFYAKSQDGRKMGNSILLKGDKVVSLWPVSRIKGELLYFVVGTFHEKTDRENEKMGKWPEIVKQFKMRK